MMELLLEPFGYHFPLLFSHYQPQNRFHSATCRFLCREWQAYRQHQRDNQQPTFMDTSQSFTKHKSGGKFWSVPEKFFGLYPEKGPVCAGRIFWSVSQ